MKTLLKIELGRAFRNKWFYITLFIELVLVLVDISTEVLPVRMDYDDFYLKTGDFYIPGAYCMWMMTHNSTIYRLFHFIFPLLVSIPYVHTIYEDIKGNYVYNIASRISKKKYYVSKLLTQFIVGTLVVAFSLTISFVLTAAILPLEHPIQASAQYILYGNCVFAALFYNHPFAAVIVFIISESVIFGIIGCIGFVFAYILNNVVMVILSSFIIYYMDYVVSSLFGRYGCLMISSKLALQFKTWAVGFIIELIVIVLIAAGMCILQMNKKDII